jgi:hypothetical protein
MDSPPFVISGRHDAQYTLNSFRCELDSTILLRSSSSGTVRPVSPTRVTEGTTQYQPGGGRPGAREELLYECRAIAADLGTLDRCR